MTQQSDLLVGAANGASVQRFDGTGGASKGAFTHGNPSPVSGPSGLVVGPGRHLFVRMWSFSGDIREYDAAGLYLRTWVARTNTAGGGMVFGPDGRLYVADWRHDLGGLVRRYDTNGAPLGVFFAPGSGGLSSPGALCFAQDGNLLVRQTNFITDTFNVLRYDGTTGAFIDEFVANKSGGLGGNGDMRIGPDGRLYVADHEHGVVRLYDGVTGAYEGDFTSGVGPFSPYGLAFDDAGDLYVSSSGTDTVLRFHGATGAFKSVFAQSSNPVPTGLTFHSSALVPSQLPPQPPPPPEVDDSILDALEHMVTPVLTGVVDDSGGVVVPPGRGPTPVPPWMQAWRQASPGERDGLAGLVVARIAGSLHDPRSREELHALALDVVSRSIARARRSATALE